MNFAKLALILLFPSCNSLAAVSRQTWDTESGLPQNTVQDILQTHDGYLWFATEGGLARFDSQRFRNFNTRNTSQLRSNDIRSLAETADGTLWIATAGGLAALQNGAFRSFTSADGLPSNSVSRLFIAGGRLCALTLAGSACWSDNRFRHAADVQPPSLKIDPDLQQYVASAVLCSYKDHEANIWIGTEATGVTILRNLPFDSYSDRSTGLDDQVRCIFIDHAGVTWFGTDSQGLIHESNGKFTRLTVADGLSSNVIVSLGESPSGDLLIGTPDGLNRLHGKTISFQTSSEGLPDDFIRSIHADPDGVVWLGTRRGLVRWSGADIHTYTHADGLGSDLIGSIIRDRAGNLWIATLQGLSRFNGASFLNFTTAEGLSNNVITALYADAGNRVWIGTQGGGLNRFSSGGIEHISLAGVPDVIYGITEDKRHDLWLASDTGIARLSLQTNQVVTYGVSDGLRVSDCSGGGHPGIAKTIDGGIWFATLRGAAYLRPDAAFDAVPPPVVVESVAVGNRLIQGTDSLSLAPNYDRLAFNFAALSFTSPQKVLFRYRLEGFDKNWVDAGNTRTASYTNLGPGDYHFRVIARNGDGVWNNQGATVALVLQPHYYQTWWFLALAVVALAAAGYGVYRWRLIRVQEQIESRFQAVLQERNRIAREIHDTLAQGFAGISVQLEMVSRKLGPSADAAREHLDQARLLVRSSLAEARRSIWELRSQSSEIEDFPARMSKMAGQMSGPGQPKIAVQVRGTLRPLPPRTEDELVRIAQEAITNAIRHAQASHIDVELAFDPKLVRVTVADDGQGFTPSGTTEGVNGHFGIKGMYERAAGIDAKLNLDTAPGAGTRLSVEVPV